MEDAQDNFTNVERKMVVPHQINNKCVIDGKAKLWDSI
jgi:hypothetical protein